MNDLRYSLRVLRNAPVFTGVAVLSLALGIGANTAIFSILHALMVRPLPVHAPQELVQITFGRSREVTNPIWEYIRDHQQTLARTFAWSTTSFNLSTGGEKQLIVGLWVSGDLFDALGVSAVIGRPLDHSDDRRGGGAHGPVAMISYDYWQRRYRGSPDVLGATLRLDGQAFTIVGVTPPRFYGLDIGGRPFEVAVPLATEAIVRGRESALDQRFSFWLRLGGRLRPGQSMAQAEAGLRAMMPDLLTAMQPEGRTAKRPNRFVSQPLTLLSAATGSSPLRTRYSTVLFTLMATVALVLLIACANLANLLLARASARRREFAVRLALGAPRARLVRQGLLESLCLAIVGAALGVIFARWASQVLVSQISFERGPAFLDLSLDWSVLAFTAGVAIVTALFFGLAPAIRSTDLSANDLLKSSGRSLGAGWRGFSLEKLLVTVQIAFSMVLVFGALLFVRTFATLTMLDAGFDRRQVLLVSLDAARTSAPEEQRSALCARVLDAVRRLPGVRHAAMSVVTPISGNSWSSGFSVEGFASANEIVYLNGVSPDYFATLGTPLYAGRDFDAHDTRGAPEVAIVNEAFARKFFGGANPVGRRFTRGGRNGQAVEIVGLVKDSKYRTLRESVPETAYLAAAQDPHPPSTVNLVVRTSSEATLLVRGVTTSVREIDKNLGLEFSTLETQVQESLSQERLMAMLSGFFGLLALLVAGIGLYGVMSLAVTRRRAEIGVRLALGADPSTVVRLVLRDVALVTTIGIAAGAVTGVLSGRLVGALLFGLEPNDATTWLLAIGALIAAAGLAGYLPARRASRIDPMLALREE